MIKGKNYTAASWIGKQDGEGIHLRIEKLHHLVNRRFKQHFILSKERILNE